VAGGIHAARVMYDMLAQQGTLLAAYQAQVARNFQEYVAIRQEYYRLEQRWRDQPYWSRRQGQVAERGVGT
jgi:hypothetical protein